MPVSDFTQSVELFTPPHTSRHSGDAKPACYFLTTRSPVKIVIIAMVLVL